MAAVAIIAGVQPISLYILTSCENAADATGLF